MYQQNTLARNPIRPQDKQDENPLYPPNKVNPKPRANQEIVDPNPMYPQNTSLIPNLQCPQDEPGTGPSREPNMSVTSSPETADDNHFIRPEADGYRGCEDVDAAVAAEEEEEKDREDHDIPILGSVAESGLVTDSIPDDDHHYIHPDADGHHEDAHDEKDAAAAAADDDDEDEDREDHGLPTTAGSVAESGQVIDSILDDDDIQPNAVVMEENDRGEYNPCHADDENLQKAFNISGDVDIQPYTVRYQGDANNSSDLPSTHAATSKDVHTSDVAIQDDDMKPYAVAHVFPNPTYSTHCSSSACQDNTGLRFPEVHRAETSSSTGHDNVARRDTSRNEASSPASVAEDSSVHDIRHSPRKLHRNPMYDRNVPPHPNPVPNARQQGSCGCGHRQMCVTAIAAAILVAFIIGMLGGMNLSAGMGDVLNAGSTNGFSEKGEPIEPPIYKISPGATLLSTPNDTKGCSGHNMTSEITIGKFGSDPGAFKGNRGVAVSAGNEIFVADLFNARIQVFNMTGCYLRLFPTVVPGKERRAMSATDVALDGDGHLWVVGQPDISLSDVHVVQYSRHGQPATTFGINVYKRRKLHPSIAFNVRDNKIVVTATPNILVFHPNGSLHQAFNGGHNVLLWFVASDDESGRILVTDHHSSVRAYDLSGRSLSTFNRFESGRCQLCQPHGILVDPAGHIIVANQDKHRVDMFTSRGEFVRTVANVTSPSGIALGPDGQLVVCNQDDNTLTIFPRRIVFP
ncbi:TRIM3 [Branchiostoma lanceolatum]|uniref:TRIM3 protein n=1 Tax=Branchiostoma lanceolatum TaxID=7740 RepID=A0A8J9VDW8_BRALA|nr:TRIM3 [Branchiostoma lanceolatum]